MIKKLEGRNQTVSTVESVVLEIGIAGCILGLKTETAEVTESRRTNSLNLAHITSKVN